MIYLFPWLLSTRGPIKSAETLAGVLGQGHVSHGYVRVFLYVDSAEWAELEGPAYFSIHTFPYVGFGYPPEGFHGPRCPIRDGLG
jgi:hypothetical protein